MSPESSLPVILVSAADSSASSHIISELIEDSKDSNAELGRVWHLENKYYTANVRLQPQVDSDPMPDHTGIEAHVIYLTEAECASGSAVESVKRRASAVSEAELLLVVAECATEGEGEEGWAAAARALHYEPVPLREPPPSDTDTDTEEEDAPFPARRGMPYVRSVLHAHVWPGLTRRPRPSSRTPPSLREVKVEQEGEVEEEEAGAVERAEQFAEALAALGAVQALPAARRRDHAEALVGAFCRALGLSPDSDIDHL